MNMDETPPDGKMTRRRAMQILGLGGAALAAYGFEALPLNAQARTPPKSMTEAEEEQLFQALKTGLEKKYERKLKYVRRVNKQDMPRPYDLYSKALNELKIQERPIAVIVFTDADSDALKIIHELRAQNIVALNGSDYNRANDEHLKNMFACELEKLPAFKPLSHRARETHRQHLNQSAEGRTP